MLKNIQLTHGLIFTQRVMTYLIENKGLSREEAYDLIQAIATQAYAQNSDFKELLLTNQQVTLYLNHSEIEQCFGLDFYLKEVDAIYNRVAL
jgi:adenylosuccinate lyase